VIDDALDELSPDTLHRVIGFNNTANNTIKPNWKQWDWFGSILLEGIKLNHQKLAPQMALVLGLTLTSTESQLPENFILNELVLQNIFESNAEAVMVELTKPFEINEAMREYQVKVHGVDFSLAAIRAQKWLERNLSQRSLPAIVNTVTPEEQGKK
jgi:hypothetical protein